MFPDSSEDDNNDGDEDESGVGNDDTCPPTPVGTVGDPKFESQCSKSYDWYRRHEENLNLITGRELNDEEKKLYEEVQRLKNFFHKKIREMKSIEHILPNTNTTNQIYFTNTNLKIKKSGNPWEIGKSRNNLNFDRVQHFKSCCVCVVTKKIK